MIRIYQEADYAAMSRRAAGIMPGDPKLKALGTSDDAGEEE